MSKDDAEEKRLLAETNIWPLDMAVEYFDLSIAQLQELGAKPQGSLIDRFDIEQRIERNQQTSLYALSLSFGVTRSSLKKAMDAEKSGLRLSDFEHEGHFLLPRSLGEAWINNLLPPNRVFSGLDSRSVALAKTNGLEIRTCETSVTFGESPPRRRYMPLYLHLERCIDRAPGVPREQQAGESRAGPCWMALHKCE